VPSRRKAVKLRRAMVTDDMYQAAPGMRLA